MGREHFTAYITKYALTEGIETVAAELCSDISDQMISFGDVDSYRGRTAHGNDWHRTPEDAITKAEKMRLAKIESLKKSITKLERITFIIKPLDAISQQE